MGTQDIHGYTGYIGVYMVYSITRVSISLRSKRFRASSSRTSGREQKKKGIPPFCFSLPL